VREVIYFKRPVYTQALTELAAIGFAGSEVPHHPVWWPEVVAYPAGRAAASVE
jgi:hypothetical protein